MSTQKETIEFLLEKLGHAERFSTRAMFGEYALYADGKVVGLVCDDMLYVKILPASIELEELCEKGEPYPGAKLHYVVEEHQLTQLDSLPGILLDVAESLPAKKKTAKKDAKNSPKKNKNTEKNKGPKTKKRRVNNRSRRRVFLGTMSALWTNQSFCCRRVGSHFLLE